MASREFIIFFSCGGVKADGYGVDKTFKLWGNIVFVDKRSVTIGVNTNGGCATPFNLLCEFK